VAHQRRIAIAASVAGLLSLRGAPGAHGDGDVAAPVLSLPFDGVWGVLQGFDGETHHGYAAFAIDFAPPQDVGAFARLAHPQLRDFACYGRPVLAPADGRVVRVATRFPDLPPYAPEPKRKPRPGAHESRGTPEGLPRRGSSREVWSPSRVPGQMSGNFVIIQHAPRVFTELVHLQSGSIRVTVGQAVRRGEPVGACGNSGNARTPHLHLGLLSSIEPIATARMPLAGYEVRGADGRWTPGDGEPRIGQWVRPAATPTGKSQSSGR
jgi:murein DD-endopeptidase MepM/ murein hydrolase activator NlpD